MEGDGSKRDSGNFYFDFFVGDGTQFILIIMTRNGEKELRNGVNRPICSSILQPICECVFSCIGIILCKS